MMPNSRAPTSQLSLKERIAALEQRNAAKKASAESSGLKPPAGSGVQGRIASFEEKGNVPAPRGSFGLGAPPSSDVASRKRGELYGNRIPPPAPRNRGVSAPLTAQNTGASQASSSSYNFGRRTSLYAEDYEEFNAQNFPRPGSSLGSQERGDSMQPLSPMDTGSSAVSESTRQRFARATDFSTALEKARVTERRASIHLRPGSLSPEPRTPSPSLSPSFPFNPSESLAETPAGSNGLEQSPIASGYFPSSQDLDSISSIGALSPRSAPVSPQHDDAQLLHTSVEDEGHKDVILEEPDTTAFEQQEPNDLPETISSQSDSTSAFLHEPREQKIEDITSNGISTPVGKTDELIVPPDSSLVSASTLQTALNGSTSEASEELDIDEPPETPAIVSQSIPKSHSSTSDIIRDPASQSRQLVSDRTAVDGPIDRISPTPDVPQTPPKNLARPSSMIHLKDEASLAQDAIPNSKPTLPSASSKAGAVSFNPPKTPPKKSVPKPSAYSVVVHGKVTEVQATSAHMQFPQTPQHPRIRQATQPQTPMSPGGFGDLALLMQNAALLEERLADGSYPSDEKRGSLLSTPVAVEEPPAPAPQTLEPPPAPQTKRRPSFRNTLSRKRSGNKDTLPPPPVTYIQPPPRDSSLPTIHSAGLPDEDVQKPKPDSLGPPKVLTTPSTPDNEIPPTPPPKSSPAKYLTGLRRFATSSRNSTTSNGALSRRSVSIASEISSEDSMPVITPPDSSAFPYTDNRELDGKVPWPTTQTPSPSKKNSATLGRAATFAQNMWSRTRAKSGASLLSTRDNDDKFFASPSKYSTDIPPQVDFSLEVPSIVVPQTTPPTPTRSHSFNALSPATSQHGVPRSSGDSLSPPSTASTPRPPSMMSVSTTTSTATLSPFLDQELFDQFPAVPELNSTSSGELRHSRSGSIPFSRHAESTLSRPSAEKRRGQIFQ